MTLKELLHTVSFEEIKPHIAILYPDMATPQMLDLFLIHYNMLCRIIPQADETEQPCIITMTKWEEDGAPILDAYNIEGCEWEVAVFKDMIVEPEVTASLAEIATCCLWHTSFYGFTHQQREETFQNFDKLYKEGLKTGFITWEEISSELELNSEKYRR